MIKKFKVIQFITTDNDGLVSISPAEIREVNADEDEEEEDD